MQPNPRIDVDTEAQEMLGLGRSPHRRWLRWLVWGLVALALLAGVAMWRARHRAAATTQYVTTPARRGDLTVTVTATGTLEALDTVDVGSEVSGRIIKINVDFNDPVRQGQVLAELDPQQANARVQQAAAQVQASRAAVQSALATAAESARTLERQRQLAASGLISQGDLDTAIATANRGSAGVASARAQAEVAEAALADAQTALSKTTIRSPIDGMVLARNVEPGQTVAASLQAPVLFQLARDLSQMTLHVQVDEADVGKVREGQSATFSVDAYPGRTFPATVTQLRNVANTDQNVVTYEAVLSVDNPRGESRPSGGNGGSSAAEASPRNGASGAAPASRAGAEQAPGAGRGAAAAVSNRDERGTTAASASAASHDLLLRPGMTGTALIRADERHDALLVPNAALRFTPPDVLSAENGQRGGLFIPGVTRGSPFGRRNQRQRAQGANGAATPADGQNAATPGGRGSAAGTPSGGTGAAPQGSPANRGGAAGEAAAGTPGAAGRGRFGQGGFAGRQSGATPQRLWVLRNGQPAAVRIGAGATDGQDTEVVWGELEEGDSVITDVATSKEAAQ